LLIVACFVALSEPAAAQTDFGVRGLPGAEAPSKAPAARTKPAAPGVFTCEVASVHDGDTFRCASGVKIRLSAIDTPEMPGACRPGRACAPGDPHAAKAALAGMIAGRTLSCENVGKSYDRVAAWCSANGVDLSCALLSKGHAVRRAQFDRKNRLARC
jgi:endonuclease YncB( thermonuclease family)